MLEVVQQTPDNAATQADRSVAILDAAEALFYRQGITAVSMRDIRTAAGVSLKKLYATFASKEELAVAYLERRNTRWLDSLATHLSATADNTPSRLEALFTWLDQWFHEDDFNGCAFVNTHGELGLLPESCQAIIRSHLDGLRSLLATKVLLDGKSGLIRARLAAELLILIQGATTTATVGGDRTAAHRTGQIADLWWQQRSTEATASP